MFIQRIQHKFYITDYYGIYFWTVCTTKRCLVHAAVSDSRRVCRVTVPVLGLRQRFREVPKGQWRHVINVISVFANWCGWSLVRWLESFSVRAEPRQESFYPPPLSFPSPSPSLPGIDLSYIGVVDSYNIIICHCVVKREQWLSFYDIFVYWYKTLFCF